MSHGSQEWGGKDLGRLKMRHGAKKSVGEKNIGEEPVGYKYLVKKSVG